MLKSLTIKNFALIDNLTIDFNNGFNVFTGETGAGKSIIVGALSLLTKGRSDTDLIKDGADKATIEGVFSISNDDTKLRNCLKENDIDFDDELIIRRTISRDQKNSIRINDTSVTLNFLIETLSPFIDIHSQKDNHYLFDKKNHLLLLDKFSDNDSILKRYAELYSEYKNELDEYNNLLNKTFNENELEVLKYQLNEINSSEIDLDEEVELLNLEKNYKLYEKYIKNLGSVIELYDGNGGVKEKLHTLIKELEIDDDRIVEVKKEIENIYYELDDKLNVIESIYSSFNSENVNIDKIEERLYIYSKLKRKYQCDVQGLIDLRKELETKLELYADRENILNDKLNKLNKAKDKAIELSKEISSIRKLNAQKLEKQINKIAKDLMLPETNFEVKFNEVEICSNGIDNVEFYISLNKGVEPKPLKNVASGGEVSRILLVLKIIFAKLSNTKLLIFDEIDSGVSGKAALSIGEKIKEISHNAQVITITHLAPVAAYADNHYYIYKMVVNGTTSTNVKELSINERFEELAIMSTGNSNSESIDVAKKLFLLAHNNEN